MVKLMSTIKLDEQVGKPVKNQIVFLLGVVLVNMGDKGLEWLAVFKAKVF